MTHGPRPCPCRRHAQQRASQARYRARHPKRAQRIMRLQYQTSRYGMSLTDRLALFEASDGLCAICYERLATDVDHDHITGQVRGALCNLCNQGMGGLRDSPDVLRSAIAYLEDPERGYSPFVESRYL